MASRRWDSIVIGGGAAGLSAALTLARARRQTLVVDARRPRNLHANESHGYLTRDGIAPDAFLEIARGEVDAYSDVERCVGNAVGVENLGANFQVTLESGVHVEGKTVLLATGMRDRLPEIPNLERFWGRTVFTCPYCDGWEVRDRRLAVYGTMLDALRLAQELVRWSADLLICARDESEAAERDRAWIEATGVELRRSRIAALHGAGDRLRTIEFADGSAVERDALFLTTSLDPACDLPERLGCAMTPDRRVAVDECMRTSIAGIYAAGDAVTERHQLVMAAASGARAAMAINDDLIDREVERAVQNRSISKAEGVPR